MYWCKFALGLPLIVVVFLILLAVVYTSSSSVRIREWTNNFQIIKKNIINSQSRLNALWIDMFSSILLAIVIYYYKNIIVFVSSTALHLLFFNCFSVHFTYNSFNETSRRDFFFERNNNRKNLEWREKKRDD